MKKYSLLLVALLGVMCWSCKKDDNKSSSATITLSAPAADASIDLSDGQPVTFSWTGVPGGAKVELSKSSNLAASQSFTATGGSLTVTAAELNAKLKLLGVAQGTEETVYWSVTPDQKGFLPEARALKVKRIPPGASAELTAPATGTVIALNYKTPDETIEFEWADADADNYEIVFSKDEDFTKTKSVTVSANTKAITHNELQTLLIDDANLGLKKYLNNSVYWNVKAGGNFISANPGLFTLSGNKIFIDKRTGPGGRSENITYEVSVITYLDNTKRVWLAENLRTKLFADGSDYLSTRDDGSDWATRPWLDYMDCPPRSGEYKSDYTSSTAGDPISQAVQNSVGIYYNTAQTEEEVNRGLAPRRVISKVIPAGWRLPFFEDFDKLYAAAQAVSGRNVLVLKDAACYPEETFPDSRELYNAWHMNMTESGSWYWNCYILELGSFWYAYGSSLAHPNPTYEKAHCFWGDLPGSDQVPYSRAFPIRLIYTGDDE